MSRRIYALAAVAALMASPASADPECFEGSCSIPERMPLVLDPPAAVPAPEAEAAPQLPAHKPVAAPRIRPQMVVDPALRPPAPALQPPVAVEPRYSVDAAPRNYERREVPRPVQRVVEVPPPGAAAEREVYTVNPGPTHSAGASSPSYVVNQGPTYGVALPVPPAEPDVIVHPYAQPDPVWQRCQTDAGGRRHIKCVPASYHPYGAGGYRPMGTYRPYRAPGVVMTAPDARIITIEPED